MNTADCTLPSSAASEDTHLIGWLAESAASEATAWERWVAEAERLAGHSLDGDEPSGDKYSMDSAYVAWKSGTTPADYVSSFRD